MSKQDYYDVLGIDRSASGDEIKKAYRKKAMKYHPDQNAGDATAEQKFKEVSEAYEILKDTQKRQTYDQYGHAAFDGSQGHPGGGGGGFSDIFDDIFSQFSGGGGGFSQSRADISGDHIRYDMEISLEESFKGVKKEISLDILASCGTCTGTGAKKGTSPISCNTCHGHGSVRMQQGFFAVERTCPDCHGLGQTISDPCKDCRGTGRKSKKKTLNVDIPAGVEDGVRIKLAGEGEAGMRGGQSGDLYVFLSVTPHDLFIRDGSTLMCHMPISMIMAALGGKIDVPSIDGTKSTITIPEGAQTGKKFRLKGKGMSILRSSQRGDLIVQILVETPVKLSKKQKELLQEFSDSCKGSKTNPESTGFFNKVKKIFDA